MLLPFSTNVWNALRFILLSLLAVPVIENALHRLHQMRTAHRLLSSKPARIRQSKIGNWGLHQEVDELNYSSKVLAVVVAVLYVGLSLYTEYASGSQQVTRTQIWQAPESKNIIQEGKIKIYDTNLVAPEPYAGCMSKASRMATHKLSEDIVERKIQRRVPSWPYEESLVAYAYNERGTSEVKIYDNGTHLLLTVTGGKHHFLKLMAVIDDEKVCLGKYFRQVCFSKRENITVLAAIGNLLYFQDVVHHYTEYHATTVPLLSNDAFTSHGLSENAEFLAHASTRTEFLERRRNFRFAYFYIRFKYAESGVGKICDENTQLQPKILRLPQSTSLIQYEKRPEIRLRLNITAMCIGIFRNNLLLFYEFANSTMVCHSANGNGFCARKHSDGSFSLSKLKQRDIFVEFVEWTLEFRDEGLGLGDVARGAMVLFMMSREVYEEQHMWPRFSEVTEKFVKQLKRGIPKLTQVGGPNSTYFEVIGKVERATVATWVLLLWVVAFFLALTYICCTNMMRSRLLPDVDFLYRRAVMQQHTRHNSVKSIRNPPTVSISKTGKFGEFSISYDAAATAKIAPGDLLM